MVIGNIMFILVIDSNANVTLENCIFAPVNRGLKVRNNGILNISNCFFLGADNESKLRPILDLWTPYDSSNCEAILGEIDGIINIIDNNQSYTRMEK
jgi:hypothetical protein